MSDSTTQHLESLLKDDGHQFAMVRKADLAALLDTMYCFKAGRGTFANKVGELRRTMAEQSQVIEEAFATIRKLSGHARKHGDERRRYMANNRALLAHQENQEATVAEMGATIDDKAAEISELNQELNAYSDLYRRNLGRLMLAESSLAIIRKAARA
jgi:vacuolar-type H+-ATPase subunit I/STV1